MRRLFMGALAVSALCAISGCKSTKSDPVCPAIAISPHATIELSPAIASNGSYELEVKADGQTEACKLEVTNMGPAKEHCPEGGGDCAVSSPPTRADMTCQAIGVAGVKNDGSVPAFQTSGTPKSLEITMKQAGATIAQASFALDYQPTELLGRGCGKTPHAEATLKITPGAEAKVGGTSDGGGAQEITPFEPKDTFGGRVPLPMEYDAKEPLSHVIRTQEEYDAFVDGLPKKKVSKMRDAGPNPDRILQKPEIDFDTHMIVIGVCKSFYCSYEFKGYTKEGDTLVVHGHLPPEPDGAAMAQRPIGMTGQDSVGNYKGLLVEKHDGPVVFREE